MSGLRRAVSADNSCHDLVGSSVRFAGLGSDATDGEGIGDARQTRGILPAARGVRGGGFGAGETHGVRIRGDDGMLVDDIDAISIVGVEPESWIT